MRSDTFIFMRASPVDLLRYLPRFLARDKTFKDIQDTLSREHENLRLKLIDVAKQFFVETATWGLKDWEDFLAITPAKDSDLELRRANVAAKLLGQSTMTIENTNNLINQYTSQGLSYIVETTGQPNVVRIEIPDVFVYFHEMRKMLWEMLPAHLWDKYLFRVEDLADDEGKNISDEFFAKVIAEYHDQYPYTNWERAAKYDGEFLHIGEIQRENSVVEIDELHLQTGFKFYDDYSLGYIRRGGYSIFYNSFNRHNNKFRYNAKKFRGGLTFHESKIFHNGIFTYGLNVLPADFFDVKVQKTFSEEIEKPVESGSLEIKIALSRRGNFHYDGTHYRGESLNFADDLSGSRSIKNICRNGEFNFDKKIERTEFGVMIE